MKKLILISLLVSLTVMCNAQEINKPKYSELNQDQLNLALKQASKTVKTGKILTWGGLGVVSIGIGMWIYAGTKSVVDGSDNTNSATMGTFLFFVGGASFYTGIPVWIVGANKKKKITLELAKFNPPGSSSINGIGIKVRF